MSVRVMKTILQLYKSFSRIRKFSFRDPRSAFTKAKLHLNLAGKRLRKNGRVGGSPYTKSANVAFVSLTTKSQKDNFLIINKINTTKKRTQTQKTGADFTAEFS